MRLFQHVMAFGAGLARWRVRAWLLGVMVFGLSTFVTASAADTSHVASVLLASPRTHSITYAAIR